MAGGLGTRMKSATPKHLHPLLGRRMVDWVLASAQPLGADPVVVVCSPLTEEAMRASLDGTVTLAVQQEARGTGDAVASARAALDGFDGDVLVLSGRHADAAGGAARRPRRGSPGRGRRGDHPRDRARGREAVRPHRPEPRRLREADRRGPRRDATSSARSASSTPRSTSSARATSGPRSRGSNRTTRRASST